MESYPWIVKEYIDRQEKWLIRRVPVLTAASRALERRAMELRKSPNAVFYIPRLVGSQDADWPRIGSSLERGSRQKIIRTARRTGYFLWRAFYPADDVYFSARRGARRAPI